VNRVYTRLSARQRHWTSYGRVQLSLGILVAMLVPFVLARVFFDRTDAPILMNSLIAGTVATGIGYFASRRFSQFPGISAIGYIIPAYSIVFLCVIAALFFLRIDYSRLLLGASFLLTLSWFAWIHLVAKRKNLYLFAVVPQGDVERLRLIETPSYHFHFLTDPHEASTNWDGVIADFRSPLSEDWERFLVASVMLGMPAYHVKTFAEQLTGRVDIEHLSENSLGSLNHQSYLQLRNLAERVLAAVALAVLLPLFALVAALIRVQSPGPVLFSQERVGYRGRSFRVLKFRTMRIREDGESDLSERDQAMTQPNDPRITPVGRFLRKMRIDELPQIINILRGEMSWIGPRPEAVPLSEWYEAELPFYRYRHMVRPGITGWAQVCQGHVIQVDDVRHKLHYDFYYIMNLSFWLDMVILFRTIRIIVTGHGAN